MQLTTTRTIDAPIDQVWALQIDHEHWPEHLPNFKKVVRHRAGEPFGTGSSADVTQPGLGTVTWTVTTFDDRDARARHYAWSGTAKGTRYEGRHQVTALEDGRTQLTLGIVAEGGLTKVLGPLVRGRMQKAIDDEAAAFERWALAVRA